MPTQQRPRIHACAALLLLAAAVRPGPARAEPFELIDEGEGRISVRVTTAAPPALERGADGSLTASDGERGYAPISPHLSAPIYTTWLALPPAAAFHFRYEIEQTEPVAWPPPCTAKERAAILAGLPDAAARAGSGSWMRNVYGVPVSLSPLIADGRGGLLWIRRAVLVLEHEVQSGRAAGTVATGRDPFEQVYRSVFLNHEAARTWRRVVEAPRGTGTGDSFASASQWVRVTLDHEDLYAITGSRLEDLGIDLHAIDPLTIRIFASDHQPLSETAAYEQLPAWMDELAIRVEGTEDARFDAGDRILFYGVGPDGWYSQYGLPDAPHERYTRNLYLTETTYWLTWNGQFEEENPRRMAEVDGSSVSEPVLTRARDRIHLEEDRIHDSRQRETRQDVAVPAAWERYWWREFRGEENNHVFTVRATIPDPDPSGAEARIRARVWGRFDLETHLSPPPPDHDLTMYVNGQSAGRRMWNDIRRAEFDSTGSQFLVDGEQVFTFDQKIYRDTTVVARVDRELLAWIEVEYTRLLKAHHDTLSFYAQGLDGTFSFEATGFTTPSVAVVDAGDPEQPRWILPAREAGAEGTTIRFRTAVSPSPASRFLLRSSASLAEPELELAHAPTGGYLRDRSDAVQMIIVTHADFRAQAEELAAFHGEDFPGRATASVAVVDVEDVMREFAFGSTDPTAIRAFLQMASRQWTGGDPDEGPAYVLYLGDAYFDFRDILKEGARNFVPTYEGYYDRSFRRTVYSPQFGSDDYYSYLDGEPDALLDLFGGRLPAETVAQAQAMVDKIEDYAANRALDPWKTRATLIADDRCQGVNDDALHFLHVDQTEQLAEEALPVEVFQDKLYLLEYGDDCQYSQKPAAAEALRQKMEAGTLLVNYTGHGSETQLADERVFEVSKVSALTNEDRLFFFLTASCSVGKYDTSGEGLGEALARHSGGGAIGVFSASAVAGSSYNAELNRTFYRCAFPGFHAGAAQPLGQAAVCGKAALGDPFQINSRRYILMGDPALTLAAPRLAIRMRLESGGVSLADSLPRGASVVLRGEITDAAGVVQEDWNGELSAQVLDSAEKRSWEYVDPRYSYPFRTSYELPGAPIYRGGAVVEAGRFEMRFQTPSALRTGARGAAMIYCYAEDGATDAAGSLLGLTVPETLPPPSNDHEGPVLSLTFDGDAENLAPGARFTASLFDSSGINITQLVGSRAVVVRVEQAGSILSAEDLSSKVVFGHDYRSATLEATLPARLATGSRYELVLDASDNLNNRSSTRAAFFLAGSGGGGFAVQELYNFPNPTPGPSRFFARVNEIAEVEVEIWTSSGRSIRHLGPSILTPSELAEDGLPWDGRDADGDPLAIGVYFYRLTARPLSGGEARSRTERLAVIR